MNRIANTKDYLPIGRLLINAFRAFERELLNRLQSQGFDDVTLSHLNVIRHLNPEGMRLIELAHDATLSKQAITKITQNLKQKAYIIISNDPEDGRAKMIYFSPRGTALVKTAISITQAIESEYLETLGKPQFKSLRKSLQTLSSEENND
ncbi:MAG TPA: hypothetical protein ENK06_03190 [Gammaproteobacteria bacterium]|nr:hypothetical protein [Gammaproteobacteria bacterium]